ncbi:MULTISPECIES: TetR/AcrR family transcriptional regulator [unclassified Corallococcus]|uniref:TetR/AcrR family transcriptional regulator n=1 Tax=unclassified Corallococcus TaxID=2685029 RepID=UPI001A8DAB51|nr:MULTISPECIES: TetR/AcrR family transcriptional regulator [unclassified Corallococcus]MBN9680820.1 TetR/AcrR family transcriptional regulator [Corallococcus sp. NCSPR001]WAS87573.1 helix-turn-helix domain containing protein [Corallococcus sp. NCRR]
MPRHADPKARSALIASARVEFAKRGVKGARISDITAASGLSKGAFYLHFPSKEALFAALVEGFLEALEVLATKRMSCMERFRADHGGLPGPGDVAARSERYVDFLRVEAALDVEMLELMWEQRELVTALIVGSQGTAFESVMWDVVDREVERIAREFHHLRGQQPDTPDVDPSLFGSFVVGTYLLLARRMGRLTQKPDLAAWAVGLQRLMHEGSLPREAVPATPAAVARPSSPPSTRRCHARADHPHRPPRKRP